MKIWVRAFIILLCLVRIGHAQSVAVRSGEHEDFSRLVIYTQSPGSWEFGRVEDGYELRLAAPEISFDMSQAFDLIPRTRIRALDDLGQGRLKVQSDCDCHAEVFVAEGGQIVIDITTGPMPDNAKSYNAYLDQRHPTLDAHINPASDAITARLGLPLLLAPQSGSQPDPDAQIDATDAHTDKQVNIHEPPVAQPAAEQQEIKDRVQQTELALIEQLGRAAAQGLVDANLSTLEAEVDRVMHPTTPQAAEPNYPDPPAPVENLEQHQHIAVQTSIDRESIEQKSIVVSTQEGMACRPDEHFEIAAWGGDIENGVDLARHKVGFLGEFDRPNKDIATARARHLIYLTFGAEAKVLVNQYRADIHAPDVLIQMAEIMDGQQSRSATALAPQMGCDGKTALWAALAQPRFRPGQEINKKSIVMSFSELPLHLRRHLGPDLAQKFLDFGDPKTAKALRDTLDRAGEDHGAGYELLEARLELQKGEHDTAENRLTEIVNHDTDMSPRAALEFVNARLSQNRPVPERIIEIASTYAYEQRETALGAELKMAEIRALAAISDFEAAYAQIERGVADEQLDPTHVAQLHRDLLEKVAHNGSDSQFARYSLGKTSLLQRMDMQLRIDISQRLLDLGFTSSARAYLDVEGNIPDARQRMIFAEIALKEFKPTVALGYLAGLESEAALILRARAMTLAKDYEAASQLYQTLNAPEEQQVADWRSGEWQSLSDQANSPLRDASRLMLTAQDNPVPAQQGSLAQNAALLETSENTRSILENLLATMPSP
ncbi:hypothetical protein [Aliiroseovarius crassostreae]|uniref:hypothetical protein n=1 Tax=Aliiroseovarius crassostreae TaxID=154981 RepID=UPI003C7C92C8